MPMLMPMPVPVPMFMPMPTYMPSPVVSKSGRRKWTLAEHLRFEEGKRLFPHGPWRAIAQYIGGGRTAMQIKRYAQTVRRREARHRQLLSMEVRYTAGIPVDTAIQVDSGTDAVRSTDYFLMGTAFPAANAEVSPLVADYSFWTWPAIADASQALPGQQHDEQELAASCMVTEYAPPQMDADEDVSMLPLPLDDRWIEDMQQNSLPQAKQDDLDTPCWMSMLEEDASDESSELLPEAIEDTDIFDMLAVDPLTAEDQAWQWCDSTVSDVADAAITAKQTDDWLEPTQAAV